MHSNSRPIKLSELILASIDLAEKSGTKLVEIRKMNSDEIHKLSRELTNEGIDEYVAVAWKHKCHMKSLQVD